MAENYKVTTNGIYRFDMTDELGDYNLGLKFDCGISQFGINNLNLKRIICR